MKNINIKKYYMRYCLSIILVVCITKANAQQDSAALYTTGNTAIVLVAPFTNSNAPHVISRAVGDSTGKYKQLATIKKVSSIAEFRKVTGDTFADSLQKQLKLADDNALWQFISTHDTLRAYGAATFNFNFLQAMGDMYADIDSKALPAGTKVYYSVQREGSPNKAILSFTVPNVIEQRPSLVNLYQDDSLIQIKWAATYTSDKNTIPGYANVYRTNTKGGFEQLPYKIRGVRVKDSVQYNFADHVVPNKWYSYYIAPVSALNKPLGITSDTVKAYSASTSNLPALKNVLATDTTAGILLTWQKLPPNINMGGIQIERSNSAMGPFDTIASVSKTDTAFLDTKTHFGKPCYYRLAVKYNDAKKKQPIVYTGFASSSHVDKKDIPDVPYNVHLVSVNKGVALAWKSVRNAALAGYYVYRGIKYDTTGMHLVSRLINDTTFTDTTKNASHRLDYIYAVKAVNIAGNQSKYSQLVQAKLPAGMDMPITPAYINITPKQNAVLIEWQDTKKNDDYITGYVLYKHKKVAGTTLKYDVTKQASAEADRLGFVAVTKAVINRPYYVDSTGLDTAYDYAVASKDLSGTLSGLSAVAVSSPTNTTLIAPVKLLIQNTDGKTELTWFKSNTKSVTSYNVYRKTVGEKGFKKIATVDGQQTTFDDKDLQSGKMYIYRVKSANDKEESVGYAENNYRVN